MFEQGDQKFTREDIDRSTAWPLLKEDGTPEKWGAVFSAQNEIRTSDEAGGCMFTDETYHKNIYTRGGWQDVPYNNFVWSNISDIDVQEFKDWDGKQYRKLTKIRGIDPANELVRGSVSREWSEVLGDRDDLPPLYYDKDSHWQLQRFPVYPGSPNETHWDHVGDWWTAKVIEEWYAKKRKGDCDRIKVPSADIENGSYYIYSEDFEETIISTLLKDEYGVISYYINGNGPDDGHVSIINYKGVTREIVRIDGNGDIDYHFQNYDDKNLDPMPKLKGDNILTKIMKKKKKSGPSMFMALAGIIVAGIAMASI